MGGIIGLFLQEEWTKFKVTVIIWQVYLAYESNVMATSFSGFCFDFMHARKF